MKMLYFSICICSYKDIFCFEIRVRWSPSYVTEGYSRFRILNGITLFTSFGVVNSNFSIFTSSCYILIFIIEFNWKNLCISWTKWELMINLYLSFWIVLNSLIFTYRSLFLNFMLRLFLFLHELFLSIFHDN